MPKWAISLAILLVCTGPAEAALDGRPSPTPWYLPRHAYVGATVSPTFSPEVMTAWEFSFWSEEYDALALTVSAGARFMVGAARVELVETSAHATRLYQHSAMIGLAYRNTRPAGFHWGFTVETGLLFYGATYDLGVPRTPLSNIGAVAGRAEVGWDIGPLVVGVEGGVLQLFEHPSYNPAVQVLGGPTIGLFADWR